MLSPIPPSPNDLTLPLIEGSLTVLSIAFAFCCPRLGSNFFRRIEVAFSRLARRRSLAVLTVGLTAFFLRLAILPFCPVPLPFVPDDFSFLLAADTFAHGRLTNSTPPMWVHFESLHITMNPSYMSMYFPSEGLVLAAGKILFGNPWFGLLLVSALMCGAICWMLQAWLPPTWALLGGVLAILRLGLFSYWINTYTGAGVITALGGALVLGSLPRLKKTVRLRYGVLMAIGIILLATTRPYEGLLLCLPVAVSLGIWIFTGKNRPGIHVLIRNAAFPLLLLVGAGTWLGYYDYRAFGSPTTLPYTVNRATYAMERYYVWQSPRPAPVYHHVAMKNFYTDNELKTARKIHTLAGFVPQTLLKGVTGVLFFAAMALLPPLFMMRRVLLDKRVRFLVISATVLIAGMTIQVFLIPHYLAPFTVVFYALGLQALRHLRVWKAGRQPVGRTMVRFLMAVCILMVGIRLYARPLHLRLAEWPASEWTGMWYGPAAFGTERAHIQTELEKLPGQQLVLVRYASDHNPIDEWVFNAANIDSSKVIWAREMNESQNGELFRYYKNRQVWLVEPDTRPQEVRPYPNANDENAKLVNQPSIQADKHRVTGDQP